MSDFSSPTNSPRSQAKHWAFTLNNYSSDDVDRLVSSVDSLGILYLIFGKEVGSSGTPHLQGHVSFMQKKRLSWLISHLGQAHYSVVRSIPRSIEYCKKEGDYSEFGTSPLVSSSAGHRSDLDLFKQAVKDGMVDLKELRETHSSVMARYHRFALSYVRDHKPMPIVADHELYQWQADLLEVLSGTPNSRDVWFVVDKTGNSGKSYFAAYCETKLPRTQVMKCGKRDDMAFELDENVKFLFIDVARSGSEFLNYQFLEDVKDGRVFSPKYESYTKRFDSPFVIVLMNTEPDMEKLSVDRYKIIIL